MTKYLVALFALSLCAAACGGVPVPTDLPGAPSAMPEAPAAPETPSAPSGAPEAPAAPSAAPKAH